MVWRTAPILTVYLIPPVKVVNRKNEFKEDQSSITETAKAYLFTTHSKNRLDHEYTIFVEFKFASQRRSDCDNLRVVLEPEFSFIDRPDKKTPENPRLSPQVRSQVLKLNYNEYYKHEPRTISPSLRRIKQTYFQPFSQNRRRNVEMKFPLIQNGQLDCKTFEASERICPLPDTSRHCDRLHSGITTPSGPAIDEIIPYLRQTEPRCRHDRE